MVELELKQASSRTAVSPEMLQTRKASGFEPLSAKCSTASVCSD